MRPGSPRPSRQGRTPSPGTRPSIPYGARSRPSFRDRKLRTDSLADVALGGRDLANLDATFRKDARSRRPGRDTTPPWVRRLVEFVDDAPVFRTGERGGGNAREEVCALERWVDTSVARAGGTDEGTKEEGTHEEGRYTQKIPTRKRRGGDGGGRVVDIPRRLRRAHVVRSRRSAGTGARSSPRCGTTSSPSWRCARVCGTKG